MRQFVIRLIFAATVGFVSVAVTAGQTNRASLQLTRDNYTDWMQHIEPAESELRWNQIGWHPDLASGITSAAKSGKPILLWTMNGHPFGCT